MRDEYNRKRTLALHRAGVSNRAIADRLGIVMATVRRYISDESAVHSIAALGLKANVAINEFTSTAVKKPISDAQIITLSRSGLSYRQIGSQYGLSKSAIAGRMYRIREREANVNA